MTSLPCCSGWMPKMHEQRERRGEDGRQRRSPSSARPPLPGAGAGRSMQASAIASGYSRIESNSERCGERVESASQRAAQRDPEVELGQVRRMRPPARELAVAHEGGDEEGHEVQHEYREIDVQHPHEREQDHEQRLQPGGPLEPDRRAARKRVDERDDVQRERREPQQRHRGDLRGDVLRHAEHEAGRREGEQHPQRALAPRRLRRRPPRIAASARACASR